MAGRTVKNIWIAGAGSGIGKALLEELQKRNNLFSVGCSRRGISFSSKLERGVNYKIDLTKEKEIIYFLEKIHEYLGKLDGVYITLGDGLFSSIENISLEAWQNHIYLNLTVPFLILKNIRNFLTTESFVCILSSTASKVGFPDSSAYCASKHGVLGLTKAIREEWKPYKIRVFNVSAGAIYTPIWENREGFQKEDMIPVEDFVKFLASFTDLPYSINLDDVYVLPLKGIL